MPPVYPIPDFWGGGGGWGARWERLPIQEGSRTQGAFSTPASAAFAAILTTSLCAPEGTVLEGEVLQGRLRHQAPWHTRERVCCGAWWVGTISRACEGLGRRAGRENTGSFEPMVSRTAVGKAA